MFKTTRDKGSDKGSSQGRSGGGGGGSTPNSPARGSGTGQRSSTTGGGFGSGGGSGSGGGFGSGGRGDLSIVPPSLASQSQEDSGLEGYVELDTPLSRMNSVDQVCSHVGYVPLHDYKLCGYEINVVVTYTMNVFIISIGISSPYFI